MRDLDKLSSADLVRLSEETIASHSERDNLIDEMAKVHNQTWNVDVPPAFMNTAKQVHNSMSKEIPTRVAGLLSMRRPSYSRHAVSDQLEDVNKAETVERYCAAADAYYSANAHPPQDAYEFAMNQLVDTGAICVASQFAPLAWASAPPLLDEKGNIVKDLWRNKAGEPTEDWGDLDLGKTANYYENVLEAYRQNARPPIVRRYLETRQCYPLFALDTMQAMFVKREVTALELDLFGFEVGDLGDVDLSVSQKYDLLEAWTPNRVRYFQNNTELRHRNWGPKGITTNYGFVPFSYNTGLAGGKPVLWLVENQIKLLDILDTYALNAIHLASFPTYKFKYNPDRKAIEVHREENGKDVLQYEIHSGEINDFGPEKEPVALEHGGLNADFYRLRDKIEESIDKIIPRALRGEAESSGYNTLQVTVQAKAIFKSLFACSVRTAQTVSLNDLRLISKFLRRGAVHLHYATKPYEAAKARLERISVRASDIQNYYQLAASVDEELDHITEGSYRAKMNAQGYGSKKWVEEGAGITDSPDMERQRAKDRVMGSPEMMKMLEIDAMEQFGMLKRKKRMAALGKIQIGPDGLPIFQMPDGNLFGPSAGVIPTQTPQMQGAAGAMLGGENLSAAPGNPNLNTVGNPEAMLPSAEGQPAAFRQGGGAIPGAAQLQNLRRPTPQIPM